MPNSLKRSVLRNVSTIQTIKTAGASDTLTLIGCHIANVDASATINVTVNLLISALVYNLQKDTPILVGSSLNIIEGKIVMEANDAIQITSTGGNCDVVLSYLEQN